MHKRWLIAISVVTFWLIMMGQLVRSEIGASRFAAARSTEPLRSPAESFFGIFLTDGQRIGVAHLRQGPETRRGRAGGRMSLEANLRLDLLGKPTDLDVSGSVWRPDVAHRAEFEFALRSAGFAFEVAGDVEGGELRAEMVSAGEVFPLRLPVDDDLIFSSGLGSALRFPRLNVGDETRLDSFDPLTFSTSEARVKCTARETLHLGGVAISTCRLTVDTGGLRSLAWIDDDGEVVRAETPIGWVLERLTPEQARLAPQPQAKAAAGLLDRTAIRPTGLKPFRSAHSMKVRLRGLGNLTLPEDRWQRSLAAGVYLIETPGGPGREYFAAEGTAEIPQRQPEPKYLAPEVLVQSDHPKIRRQATLIIRGEEDLWRRAAKIHDWVFSHLEKTAVVSIPSALEVLEQRRGDCNEHAVLFTALARAASVPARIAVGIVWSDELQGFYYHAWPEIYIDGWAWMDPTLGQSLADATHIKLLDGGIEAWPQLLPYLGKLEIEVLAIE